ncbi:MAG: response regulator [Pseudomonadota bacterium]
MSGNMADKKALRQTILIVDDTPANLDVLKGVLGNSYEIKAAINGNIALKIANMQPPDLILLDIMMPEMDGYEVCKQLKANQKTFNIPVIFITAMLDAKDEQKGFDVGGVDYITKPINPGIVKSRVKTHLALANQQRACQFIVDMQTKELMDNQKSAIYMLGEAGHYNDTDTGVHIWRMASYSAALAHALNWPVPQVELLEMAAPMHDMGKIGIPDSILKAPRKLSDEEWLIMQGHSIIGYQILKKGKSHLFHMAAEIALSHHEKYDGTGYPEGLKAERIPESARIVAIADVFDALTMERPYKKAWPGEKALTLIEEESGKHFDPDFVSTFLAIQDEIIQIKEDWEDKKSKLLL